MTASLLESTLASGEASAVFGAAATLQAVLDFEAALVRAEAAESRMPIAAAQAIAGVCKIGLFDLLSLVSAAAATGNMVAPMLARLRETVSLFDADAAHFVRAPDHLQSAALQTAMALQMRRVLALIDRDLGRLMIEALHLMSMQALAASTGPIELAAQQLLAAQHQLRERGATALQLRLTAKGSDRIDPGEMQASVAASIAEQLDLEHKPGPAGEYHADLIRLSCELAMLCACLERLVSLLPRLPGPAGGGAGVGNAEPIDQASAVVRAWARRAPQRVATMLALNGDAADCHLIAAEVAALLAGAHGSVAAARRATLACGEGVQASPQARQKRKPAAGSAASPATNESRTALAALARQQAEHAPWLRWAN